MTLTMQEIRPIGLCVSTLDLFDTRKFLLGYCDHLVLRGEDPRLTQILTQFKRELNSSMSQPKFLNGYKAVIANNIDKIISLVEARYAKTYSGDVDLVRIQGKKLIDRVLSATSFDMIGSMEDDFKTKVLLPTYRLFIDDMKRTGTSFV